MATRVAGGKIILLFQRFVVFVSHILKIIKVELIRFKSFWKMQMGDLNKDEKTLSWIFIYKE